MQRRAEPQPGSAGAGERTPCDGRIVGVVREDLCIARAITGPAHFDARAPAVDAERTACEPRPGLLLAPPVDHPFILRGFVGLLILPRVLGSTFHGSPLPRAHHEDGRRADRGREHAVINAAETHPGLDTNGAAGHAPPATGFLLTGPPAR